MTSRLLVAVTALMGLISGIAACGEKETLPPLEGDVAPQSFEELWAGYDPRVEPLEIEILKEWEEDDAVLRIVHYRIGIFKG